MKKSSKILLSLVVVVALLAIIYRLVNKAPSSELAPNEQIVEVMYREWDESPRWQIEAQQADSGRIQTVYP